MKMGHFIYPLVPPFFLHISGRDNGSRKVIIRNTDTKGNKNTLRHTNLKKATLFMVDENATIV